MFELKPLSKEAVPQALEKAIRYRLLNDPWQAESICRDILQAEPDNQEAILTLILSITDQFEGKFRRGLSDAMEVVSRLEDAYERLYYKGLIYERQATAALKRGTPRSSYIAYEHIRKAMTCYQKAEQSHPDKNEESVLRWNACVRLITERKLEPAPEDQGIQPFLDV